MYTGDADIKLTFTDVNSPAHKYGAKRERVRKRAAYQGGKKGKEGGTWQIIFICMPPSSTLILSCCFPRKERERESLIN